MKTIMFILFAVAFQTSFSQNREKVEIDENVSIIMPGPITRTQTGDNFIITAITPSGTLIVERTNLPDSLKIDISRVDILEFFTKGYFYGLEHSGNIEILENTGVLINNIKARNILFRINSGQLNQFYFLTINRKMYVIKFKETLSPSATDRQKIFSSIEII